jgi:hypothetical protein
MGAETTPSSLGSGIAAAVVGTSALNMITEINEERIAIPIHGFSVSMMPPFCFQLRIRPLMVC